MKNLKSTRLGTRVSELYLDPYTADYLIKSMEQLNKKEYTDFAILQIFSNTFEIRPLLNVKKSDEELINDLLLENELLFPEPNIYDPEYDEFNKTLKTAGFFNYWIDETSEQELFEKFNIRPGEIHAKLKIIDWLFYSTEELSRLTDLKKSVSLLRRLRLRLKYGVKEELLTLLKLKGVGRVRARKMYSQGIKTLRELKKTDFITLAKLLGEKTALKIRTQL
jgi:helicase